MSKTIWKFPVGITGQWWITMPGNAQILSVQLQADGALRLWALVDQDIPLVRRMIEVFGTGHPMDDSPRKHLGTVQIGSLVWHVFENLGTTPA